MFSTVPGQTQEFLISQAELTVEQVLSPTEKRWAYTEYT